MKVTSSEQGAINILLIPLIASIILLLGAMGFGVWAYASRDDYKNNSDQKSAAAVAVAKEETKSSLENEFLEREKYELKTYQGLPALGSIKFEYPKTWSVYEALTSNSISLTMHPNRIPSSPETAYALRVEVVSTNYDKVVDAFSSSVKKGTVRAAAYHMPEMPENLGTRFEGEVEKGKFGVFVAVPLRDKTIKVWTESDQYIKDLDEIILKTFAFNP